MTTIPFPTPSTEAKSEGLRISGNDRFIPEVIFLRELARWLEELPLTPERTPPVPEVKPPTRREPFSFD